MSNLPVLYDFKQIKHISNPILIAVDRFLLEVKRDLAVTSYKTYRAKISVFNEWVTLYSITSSSRDDLKHFKSWLLDRYTSAATINLTLSVVRGFYKSLHERGVIDHDPTAVLKNVQDSDSMKKSALSRDQFYMILSELKKDTSLNAHRNRTLFVLLIMNGLRISEAASACIEDIQMDRGRMLLYLKRKGYRDKTNFVVLQDKTHKMILDLVKDRTGSIFTSYRTGKAMTGGDLSRIVKTIFRKCGIDSSKITSHSCRHTYAIFALEGGADLMSLSQSLNHKNLSTTQTYLRSYNRLRNSAEDAINLDF